MPEAYIYDHVRTPRGRGKPDGALHEVTALALATAPLRALKERNNLKEDVVDDVVLGVVDPVGEAGSDIARFDRAQIRLCALCRRRLCGAKPAARRQGLGRGPFQEFGSPGEGCQRAHD